MAVPIRGLPVGSARDSYELVLCQGHNLSDMGSHDGFHRPVL